MVVGKALVGIVETTHSSRYMKMAHRGLEIYAIGNDFESEPWQEYLKDLNTMVDSRK